MQSKHNNITNPVYSKEDPLTRLLGDVRRSALAGALSVIPVARVDVVDDIVSWALVEVARRHEQIDIHGGKRILQPTAYAYRIAQREAVHWLEDEKKVVSLDVKPFQLNDSHSNGGGVSFSDFIEGIIEPNLVLREELLEGLPELLGRFQQKIINLLQAEDKKFFELYFIKRLSVQEVADELGIFPKSVMQKWRRLLSALHESLLADLRTWPLGKELFLDVFQDFDRVAELLCLLRLFLEEGLDAVKALIES